MVAILMRHAHDNEPNSRYRHDKEITREGKREAGKVARKLIKKYGNPDIIYCSPMTRTRQTLKYMLRYVPGDPEVIVDNRLSRYFNDREKRNPSVSRRTLRRNIPIHETHNGFRRRCDSFLDDVKQNKYHRSSGKKIWIISHVLVLKRITRKLGIRISRHVNFLEYYKM
jgi:broad specificity phosphatase PhoE